MLRKPLVAQVLDNGKNIKVAVQHVELLKTEESVSPLESASHLQ